MNQDRTVEVLRQRGLVRPAEIAAPFEGQAFSLQDFDRLVVRDARERRLHPRQSAHIPLEDGQLPPPALEDPPDQRDEEAFGQLHHVVEIGVGHLGFDHPEFRQMTSGL